VLRRIPWPAASKGGAVRGLVKEICFPRCRVWYLLFVALVWAGLDYWIACVRFEPSVPWDVRVIYRAEGDTQYIAMVSNLSRFIFGEANLLDSYRTGLQGFPIGSLALHSLCVAIFGVWGYPLGDALAFFGSFVALALFLCVAGVPVGLSRVASAFSLLGVTAAKWLELSQQQLLPTLSWTMGGMRLPRPLVTDGLALCTLALALTYLQPGRFARSTTRAVALGASFALLVQGDIHGATGVALALGLILLVNLVRQRLARPAWRELALVAGGAVVVLIPFLVQQLAIHPDITPRMGAFAVSRSSPPHQLVEWWPRLKQVLVLLAFTGLLGAALGRRAGYARSWPVVLGLAFIAGAYYFAMPAFGALTGKNIQIYHFPDRFERGTTWVVLAGLSLVLAWLTRRPLLALLRRSRRPTLVARLAEALAAAALAYLAVSTLSARDHIVVQETPRPGLQLGGGYKADFVALTKELAQPRYDELRVLGTLDHATSVWWTAFQHRFVLLCDPFASTRSDAEQERRFAHFLHLLGVSSQNFKNWITEPLWHVFWISSAKYTVSPLHSFAPITDYTPHQARLISHGSPMSGWDWALPKSEARRLARLYDEEPTLPWKFASPDLIVLSKLELGKGMLPNEASFRLTYSNPTFKVWVRR
jgi:hypothetical protein